MYKKLEGKIIDKKVIVGVIGLGYVGLPNAVFYAKRGFNVIGFDVDEQKINSLSEGVSYIDDVSSEDLLLVKNKGKFSATTDLTRLAEADVIFIDVPTPIDENKTPDLSYIASASNAVLNNIRKGQLIVLESTVYPTTTREYIVTPLEKMGFTIGEDVFVAYSQERIDPNNQDFDIESIPKVIGGATKNSAFLLEKLIDNNSYIVNSLEAAELTKLYENTFRFVNIALANEFAKVSDELDVNVFEMIDAAATKPFGFMPFYPNIEVGGHCIPIDPYYLSWHMQSTKVSTPLIVAAGEVNDSMVAYTVNKILRIFNRDGKSMMGRSITIIGATYKKDVADMRMSSIQNLSKELLELGVNVTIYDNLVVDKEVNGVIIKELNYDEIKDADMTIALVNHSYIDKKVVYENSSLILDAQNAYGEFGQDKVEYI